ncbi:MAG: hypothetical protein IKZ25_02515 [Clostridia bacterium]|nr:hypothetical protein [Clostridia bacterium]
MKFAILESRKKSSMFQRKIKFEEVFFRDKSFYYIEIYRKNPCCNFEEKEIKKLKKLFIRLDIGEIIYKGNEKSLFTLKDNINIIDGASLFIEYMKSCCEKIIRDSSLSPKEVKIFIYDPFLKYGEKLIYELSKISSAVKIFTFKEETAKNISRDIMQNFGACVLWTSYIEKIEDYKIIILCANSKGFFMDREVNKNSLIFTPEKQNKKSIYNIIDEINIRLPPNMEEFRRFSCNFLLLSAFIKYNFINPPKEDIISFRGYNKEYYQDDIARILNNS